jgi:hypothetical protein
MQIVDHALVAGLVRRAGAARATARVAPAGAPVARGVKAARPAWSGTWRAAPAHTRRVTAGRRHRLLHERRVGDRVGHNTANATAGVVPAGAVYESETEI